MAEENDGLTGYRPNIQAHILELLGKYPKGLTSGELAQQLRGSDRYAAYDLEAIIDRMFTQLDELRRQHRIMRRKGLYFLAGQKSILQDTPARPEEYLLPEILDSARRKES